MHVPTDPPPTPSAIATIGVYGFAGNSFLERLSAADVRIVLDVRQRRGVRGPQYAWANSRRLQDALAAASLGYRHHPELAPTTELRQLQYAEDARLGVGKRSRHVKLRTAADIEPDAITTEFFNSPWAKIRNVLNKVRNPDQAAIMRGDGPTARQLAARAKTRFAIGSPGWVKADDIVKIFTAGEGGDVT